MSTATQQDQAKSPARRVLDHIAEQRFTGVLRVRSREASGEFWFLVGILESAQFGVSKADEAIERLLRATEVVFEAELRLPHLSGGFKKRMPAAGSFAETRPVALMRYCENYALTCVLVLKGKDRTVRISYRLGELLSADAGGGGNETLPALLESEEGDYEFVLPAFELPAGVNTIVESARPSLAERIDRSLAEQDEVATAEAKRKADEAAAAEAKRKADEAAAEAKRKLDEAAAAEAKRKAEAAAAEAKRKADEAARAEAKRKADEAEAKRKAEEAEAKRKAEEAEAKRKAEEAEAKRRADEAEAEAKRKAGEAEAKPKADEADAARAKRKAGEAAAGAKRDTKAEDREPSGPSSEKQLPARAAAKGSENKQAPSEAASDEADAAAIVDRKRGFPWVWLVLLLIAAGVAYFLLQQRGLR
ncbi:MAG TPA: hypothetical protein VG937_05740 [Polyangiaceae bacterium]|nr:hypothetical protein [Polyangiaceae bacterium]